jgi:hypothetical protein
MKSNAKNCFQNEAKNVSSIFLFKTLFGDDIFLPQFRPTFNNKTSFLPVMFSNHFLEVINYSGAC